MPLNLDHQKTYLLACSFGPDSMALFDMLRQEKYSFSVAHVNYGLRPEAKNETERLIEYCEKYDIELFVLMSEEKPNKNIEERCRNIRYRYFDSLVKIHHFDYLLVGHQEDDLLETYFLQKARQNFVSHYGLRYENQISSLVILRPLLHFTKADLLAYCHDHKVPYAIDSSNLTDQFERNKIRHQFIEQMPIENRKILLEQIEEENAKLDALISSIDLSKISDVSYLLSLDDVSLAYALHFLGRKVFPSLELSHRCVSEIKKALLASKPNISMKVKKDVLFVKAYNECKFAKDCLQEGYSFTLLKPGVLDTDSFYLDFSLDSSNRNVKIDDYPLIIRNASPLDVYEIRDYKVEVRRLFIDWKMPSNLRKRWPVILNNQGRIIYIPRYQKDFVWNKNVNFYVK